MKLLNLIKLLLSLQSFYKNEIKQLSHISFLNPTLVLDIYARISFNNNVNALHTKRISNLYLHAICFKRPDIKIDVVHVNANVNSIFLSV